MVPETTVEHAMSKAWYIWLRDVGKHDKPWEVAIAKRAFEDGWILALRSMQHD